MTNFYKNIFKLITFKIIKLHGFTKKLPVVFTNEL